MTRRAQPVRTGPEPAPRLRVRRPADFLAVIPYLLGFHPTESLVVVLSARGRVVLTARLDLPPPDDVGAVAAHLLRLAAQHHVDELVLVGYSDDELVTRPVIGALGALLESAARVREVLLVGPARWWSLTCTSGCCPPEGVALVPETPALAAEAVYAGLSVQSSRAALAEQVAGPVAASWPRLQRLLGRARASTRGLDRSVAAGRMAAAVRRGLTGGGPDEAGCAELAVLALDLAVRDVAWAMMSREEVEDHLRLWSQVVAHVPPEVASAPLGLLGVAAWINGHGALLNCCVERLETLDPRYTLGHLLADISDRALPPDVWEGLAGGLREEVAAVTGLAGLH